MSLGEFMNNVALTKLAGTTGILGHGGSSFITQLMLMCSMVTLLAIKEHIRFAINYVINRFLSLFKSTKPSLTFTATRLRNRPDCGLVTTDEFRPWVAYIKSIIEKESKDGEKPATIRNLIACKMGDLVSIGQRTMKEESRLMKGQGTEWLPKLNCVYDIDPHFSIFLRRQINDGSPGVSTSYDILLDVIATSQSSNFDLLKKHEEVSREYR